MCDKRLSPRPITTCVVRSQGWFYHLGHLMTRVSGVSTRDDGSYGSFYFYCDYRNCGSFCSTMMSFIPELLISCTRRSNAWSARLPKDFWSSAGESKIRGMSQRPVFSLTHISTSSAATRGSMFWFLRAKEQEEQAFREHHVLEGVMDAKVEEFYNIAQGSQKITEYANRFTRMMQYAPSETDSEKKKMYFFKKGLNTRIKVDN